MIVLGAGDDYKEIKRALSSIATHVDGIYVTITGEKEKTEKTRRVIEKFGGVVSYARCQLTVTKKHVDWCKKFFGYDPYMKVGSKIFLFDKARNFNMAQVPDEYDWYFWIDDDDVVRNGEKLKELAVEMSEKNIEAVYLNYLYQVDFEKGHEDKLYQDRPIKNIVIEHIRERLVRLNGHFKWIAPIHETLIEQTATNKTDNYNLDVVQISHLADRMASLTRNLPNLELAILQSEGKDPRHLYYLAKAYYDESSVESTDRAIPLIKDYLFGDDKSGWPQERSQASCILAELYLKKGMPEQAIRSGMNALIEDPENPAIFVNLATSYAHKKEWDKVLFWVRVATKIPESKTTLVKNPRNLRGAILELIYNASLNKGQIDDAWNAAVKIVEMIPDDPQAKEVFKYIDALKEQRDITKSVVRLAEYLKKTGEIHKVKPLLASTPKIAEETPFIQDLRLKNNPPKHWEKDEIVIFCGPGFTNWSPKGLSDPGENFVGGSEEAVMYMSAALAKIGWKVYVYADPGDDEGEYDGVHYLPYYKFNNYDHFNILVAWRNVAMFDNPLNYKKGYVWLHDIQNPLDWTDERVKKVTKIMFLSKWHRSNVPDLPDDIVMLTSNGL